MHFYAFIHFIHFLPADISERTLINAEKQHQDMTQLIHTRQKTHEELLAQGYVLDADGDYIKKIPKWKFNKNTIANINAKINSSIMS
jgi:hypothetical protein